MKLRAFAIPSFAMATMAVMGACASRDDASSATVAEEELWFEVLHAGIDAAADLRPRERFDALPRELAASPADVLCIQGIADPADRAALKTALGKVFPISLDLPTDDASVASDPRDATGRTPAAPTRPPCAGFALGVQAAASCLSPCMTTPSGSLRFTACADEIACWPEVVLDGDPERRCPSCIADHLRTGATWAETAQRCSETIHPLSQHGQHGMMLLSKLPLSRPSIHVLPSEGTRRAVVGATVTTARGTEIDVVCASLGPTQESALPSDARVSSPYPGPYGSPTDGWLRENELHVEQLGAWVASRRGDRPAIVLGNFGTSTEVVRHGRVVLPAAGPIAAKRLNDLFAPGIAPSYVPSCTVCQENTVVAGVAVERAESFHNRIYLSGLPSTAVRASARSYLGDVVAEPPDRPNVGRAPITMQYGFRSKIAIPHR